MHVPSVAALAVLVLLTASPPPDANGSPPAANDQGIAALFATRVTTGNLVGVTISNYGFIGNSFVSRSPSFEYPLGSGYEHLVHGGLWIGARATDDAGEFTGVTTACLDVGMGGSSAAVTEFTPASDAVRMRSIVPSSPYYDPSAVSELDYVADYDDLTSKSTSGNPEPHRPLRVAVHQENYTWNSGEYPHVLFFRCVIRNLGLPLTNAWVGVYSELASGNKNAYSCWPPSSACSTTGGWFAKKWLQYDVSRRLIREHYCAAQPVPDGCQLSRVPYWAGIKLLTRPTSGQQVTLAAWPYSPSDPARDQDQERYAIMSAGTVADLSDPSLMPQTGDPVELIALGPFARIESGDSITVDFALLGGAEVADLQAHADAAQAEYDSGYPPSPPAAVEPLAGARFGLERLWPNPAAGIRLTVSFSLDGRTPATLELLDLSGRRVLSRDVGSLGPGRHALRLDEASTLPPGGYFVRLTEGNRAVARKAFIVR